MVVSIVITKWQAQNQYYDEFIEDHLVLRMMLIPEGTFLMGSPDTELERFDREGPQHQVSVASFFMGKYPITQAQWHTVARLPQVNQKLKLEPSHFKEANRPVEQVSWYDAVELAIKLQLLAIEPE